MVLVKQQAANDAMRRSCTLLGIFCFLFWSAPLPVACFSQNAARLAVARKYDFKTSRPRAFPRFMVATGEKEIAMNVDAADLISALPELDGGNVAEEEGEGRLAIPFEQGRKVDLFNILDEPSLFTGRALVLTAAAIYGTNFAMVKMLEEQVPTAVSASLRFVLAAAAVGGAVLMNEKETEDAAVHKERLLSTLAGMEVGCWYCIGYLCQSLGLHTVDASKSAFFNALAVIIVPLLDLFFREIKMTTSRALSVVLAMAGVGLLQLGPNQVGQVTQGDLFCLCQALFFGIGYWRLESASATFPTQAARSTAGQLVAVALGSVVYMLTLGGGLPSLQSLQGWLTDDFVVTALLWTGLVSTALALYLETVALKVVSAAELTVLMTSVSLWGSAFAFVSMNETMSMQGLVGGMMILGGCILSAGGGNNDEEDAKILQE